MANALFDKYRENLLLGGADRVDWDGDTIKVVLVDHGTDTPVPSTDQYLSDIAAGARVAISGALTTKTGSAGVADADDVTIPTVSGASFESVVLFKDTGTPSSSPLIAFIDTATGLPFSPSGGDILIAWSNGANRIYKL